MNTMKFIYKILSAFLIAAVFSACEIFEIDPVTNPNAADAAVVESGATQSQLQGLVTGLESRHRNYVALTSRAFGTFGREILPYRDSDPRYTQDWLGRELPPDPQFFLVNNIYNSAYQAIKQANFLMESAANTSSVTASDLAGINGFAKTIQGWQYMIVYLHQYDNGMRIDVDDPLNPGPRLSRTEALAQIRTILDDGFNDLNGATFPFTLTAGFVDRTNRNGDSFNSVTGLMQINRAIAARAAIYAEDWSGALSALNQSFMGDINSLTVDDLQIGPAHSYSGPPGFFNPLFFPFDVFSTQMEVVHPVVLRDTVAGDLRNDKFFERVNNPVTNQALQEYTATHQDGRWPNNTADIPFIRIEELVLIYAEASAQSGNVGDAVNAIDQIRTLNNIGPYTGATDTQSLIDEILFQRRYSLWFESLPHRWVDLRRYNRLSDLEGNWQTTNGAFIASDEEIFTQMAIPQAELSWDALQNQ